MLDYYRGISSYEDAVKNRLESIGETGIATTQAVHNLESGLRSEIQANTNAIQDMALGLRSDIRESTYAIVASQQMLANTFVHGFNAINKTLDFGFGLVGNKIDILSDRICSKLDQIHDILNNPRLTESRELFRQAHISYNKGFYEEALEDCLGAVEKNKTDYISWYLLGLIYLFGAGKFSNVIDLDKAEEAFFTAAKYIDPDIGQSEEANLFASEIYYYLGYTHLIKSNDYLIENKIDDSNSKLIEAEKASATAYQLSKENLLARYEQAKELHFLGKDDEALYLLEELIRKEKNFAIKAVNDKNFESLWGKINVIIEHLRDEVAEEIKKKTKQCLNEIENELKSAKNLLAEFDSFLSEEQIKQFDDFYNANFANFRRREGHEAYKAYKALCDKFDSLAKKIALQKNPNCEKGFSLSYISLSNYKINLYHEHDNEYFDVITEERVLLVKKELENNLTLIESEIRDLESLKNKDYFYLLERSNGLEEIFSSYERRFLYIDFLYIHRDRFRWKSPYGDSFSQIGSYDINGQFRLASHGASFYSVFEIIRKRTKCMQYYIDTQKGWEQEEKQQQEEKKHAEEARKKNNKKITIISLIIGSVIGIIGVGILYLLEPHHSTCTSISMWVGIIVASLFFLLVLIVGEGFLERVLGGVLVSGFCGGIFYLLLMLFFNCTTEWNFPLGSIGISTLVSYIVCLCFQPAAPTE